MPTGHFNDLSEIHFHERFKTIDRQKAAREVLKHADRIKKFKRGQMGKEVFEIDKKLAKPTLEYTRSGERNPKFVDPAVLRDQRDASINYYEKCSDRVDKFKNRRLEVITKTDDRTLRAALPKREARLAVIEQRQQAQRLTFTQRFMAMIAGKPPTVTVEGSKPTSPAREPHEQSKVTAPDAAPAHDVPEVEVAELAETPPALSPEHYAIALQAARDHRAAAEPQTPSVEQHPDFPDARRITPEFNEISR